MKFAPNLSLMYNEWPFAERMAAAADDGFKHVECMFPYEISASELASRARDAGVEFVLINASAGDWAAGDRGLGCDAANRDRFKRAAEEALSYALALGVRQIHVLSGQTQNRQRAYDVYRENLRWLGDQFSQEPLVWNVEPINTRDVPRYLVNTQEEAHKLIEEVGAANLRVQMDLYHCQIVEGDVITKLRTYLPGGKVGHLQIAGVPERHEPSFSELDYTRVFKELQRLGYSGYIGCEYRPQCGTREGLGWLRQTGF